MKQQPLQIDDDLAGQLRLRLMIEGRPMNDIVGEAIRDSTSAHPVSREDILLQPRAIASADAALLEALAKA